MPAISSTAVKNAASLLFDGLLKPVIFLTNCSDAARTSSSVTGGSKLKRVLIFRHIQRPPVLVYSGNSPNTPTPFFVPTYTLPLAMVGVIYLLPSPNWSRPFGA